MENNFFSFYIMTEKGYRCLKYVIENNYHKFLKYVVGSRDFALEKDYYDEIKNLCESNSIPFFSRTSFVGDDDCLKIAISWRWLINSEPQKLIVLHDSLLPKYRGFAPLVNSLIYGEEELGVTAIFATEKYDRGDILAQSAVKIQYPIKIQEAIEIISNNYFEVLKHLIKKIEASKELIGLKQDEKKASYSLWRDEDDYKINWNSSAQEIERFVNALGYPYKGALTRIKGRTIRVLDVEPLPNVNVVPRDVGKLISIEDGKATVVCGKGLLKIITAYYDDNRENIYPLTNFRIRFQ